MTDLATEENLSLVTKIAFGGDISVLFSLDPSLQLELTSAAIKLNPENSFAWEARCQVLVGVPDYFSTELDTIMALLPEFNHNHANVRFHRLFIAKFLGFDAMLKEFKHTLNHLRESPNDSNGAWHNLKILSLEVWNNTSVVADEFNLLKKIINEDKKNRHAWSHLGETMTRKFGGETARSELKEMAKLLKVEPKHNLAWGYLIRLAKWFGLECSAIELVDDIILDDGFNASAWTCRWAVCAEKVLGMTKEFEFTRKVLLKDATNTHAWDYRLHLLENCAKMEKGVVADFYRQEDEFTKLILSQRENANIARVWYQRRWLLETFGERGAELTYSTQFVENDVDNECAWQHRSFVLLSGGDLVDSMRTSEVKRVTMAIRTNPKNRFLWMYLQSLYIPTPSHDINLGSLFASICCGAHDQFQNIIIITNALETLCCVISLGYKPSGKLGDFMTDWFSSNTLSVDNTNLGKLKPCDKNPRSERKICFDDFMHTEKILLGDPSNKKAWSKRKSFLTRWRADEKEHIPQNEGLKRYDARSCVEQSVDEPLHGWKKKELELCDQLIQAHKNDGSDECAWNQRYFVVGKSGPKEELKAEALYAINVILATPENKHAWAYLRCMYRLWKEDKVVCEFEDELLDDLFLTVFNAKDEALMKYKGSHKDFILKRIIMNKTKIINASEALLDLLSVGYLATPLVHPLKKLDPSTTAQVGLVEAICNILEFACPIGVCYWRWRVEKMACGKDL